MVGTGAAAWLAAGPDLLFHVVCHDAALHLQRSRRRGREKSGREEEGMVEIQYPRRQVAERLMAQWTQVHVQGGALQRCYCFLQVGYRARSL